MKTIWVVIASVVFGVALGVGGAVVEFGLSGAAPDIESGFMQHGSGQYPELAPADGRRPKLHVDAKEFDFGRMDRRESKSHGFVFTNVGDAPLTLIAGKTSCKCTLSALEDETLSPGESTTVTLEWKATGEESDFRETAAILTNDPDQRRVELTVSGVITDSIRIAPSNVTFSRLLAGSQQTAEVRVLSFLEEDIQILDKQFAREDLAEQFEITEEDLPRDEIEASGALAGKLLTVTAKPGIPMGVFGEQLEIVTNLPGGEKLTIPVRGRVVGELSIVGSLWDRERGLLSLGNVDRAKGTRVKLVVIVRGADSGTIEITPDQVEPAELKVTVGEPKPIRAGTVVQVPLTIEIPPGTPPMVHLSQEQGGFGEILLQTNHPRDKELRLKVRFAVSD